MKIPDSTLAKEHQSSFGTGSWKTGEIRSLFSWDDVEMLPDLQRLALVLDSLPDDQVIEALEVRRGNGRNEYPVRAMWRTLLASFVFQHVSIESLERELNRNRELMSILASTRCRGARPHRKLVQDPEKGVTVVEFPKPQISSAPNTWNFSRFIHLAEEVEGETGHVSGMMDTLREQLQNLLSDFGEHKGYDGKAIERHSAGQVNRETGEASDPDADRDKHETHSVDARGKSRTRTRIWFGYRLHLIADTVHELPIAFEVTRASTSESVILPKMINKLFSEDSDLKERCNDFSADRGLDSGPLKKMLWEDHQVRPLIDVRQMWREEKAEPGYDPKQEIRRQLLAEPGDNIPYSGQGNVYC